MKRHPRLIAVLVALISVGIAAVYAVVDYRVRPRLIAGPMLQELRPGGYTFVWRVQPHRDAVVQIEAEDGTVVASLRGEPDPKVDGQYVARLDGQKPGERLHYQVVTADERHPVALSNRYVFRTPPAPEGALRFVAFGDSGRGTPAAYQLGKLMARYAPDVAIHTGDVISPDGLAETFATKLYLPFRDLLATAAMYPCLGNHEFRTDGGQPVLDAFVLPANGPEGQDPERNYYADIGPARFVAIDSNDDYPVYRDVIAPWLDEVLAGAGDRWKIVFFHEPVYTSGRYEPAEKLRLSLLPLFDKHRVELTLAGHDHMYARSHPMRGDEIAADGDGTVHVISGAGGNNLYALRTPPPAWLAEWCDDRHSFTLIDLTPESLLLRQIAANGETLDTAFIKPRH